MKIVFRYILCLLALTFALNISAQNKIPNDSIFCRDPFITVDRQNKCYYLIISQLKDKTGGLYAYKSNDLKWWERVGYVFVAPKNYPGTNDWWAPDTYYYKGHYYCFVTVSNPAKGILRGTTVLKSEKGAAGPYHPILPDKKLYLTPQGMQCLDGSLYVDAKGNPWIVFCVEWCGPNVKNGVGEIWCQRLKKDLCGTIGKPHRLFGANEAPWPTQVSGGAGTGYVTDASFIFKDEKSGNLIMLWSSFSPRYSIGQAICKSGDILGKWEQLPEPIFSEDGGHQMIFRDLNGNLKISFHQPNSENSCLHIKDVKIEDGKFLPIK